MKFNGTPRGTEWAMPRGFFINDVIRLNWMGDACPAINDFTSAGRLRQAWVVKTRRNLCGGSTGSASPLVDAAPSGEPKALAGEPAVSLGRRNDLLLNSNNGEEHEENDDIFYSAE